MSEQKMEEKPIEIHVDLENILKKIDEKFAVLEAKLNPPKTESKGEVLPVETENRYKKILEALKHGGLKEQWTKPLALPKAPAANLLAYLQVTDALSNEKPGDTVNIPYVKSFKAAAPSGGIGGTLSEATGIIGSVSATVGEVGRYTQVGYHEVEKFTEAIIARLEEKFEQALIRGMDEAVYKTLESMGEAGSPTINVLDKSSAVVFFDADWIADALLEMGKDEKSMAPGEYVLVISPHMYNDLYKDIASSQALVYARPDVVREGLVSEFMGVPILVSVDLPTHASNAYWAFMIHRDSITVAPKREMLIETEKDTVARKIKITGTATFAHAVVDGDSICGIKTKAVA